MARVLVAPELTRFLPLANTTPSGMLVPGTVGSSPRLYFNQLGTPSPDGFAFGPALGLFAEPKYWACQASGKPSLLASPVRSAIEALSKPVAKGALCTPLLPSLFTNCQL